MELPQRLADTLDLEPHRVAFDLCRVCRDGELQVEPTEELARLLARPTAALQRLHGGGEALAARLSHVGADLAVAVDAHTVDLFGQVHELEVDGEGPHEFLCGNGV